MSIFAREMGYHAVHTWRTGHVFGSEQSDREVSLGSVTCNSDVWSECQASDDVTSFSHDNDVLLSCEFGQF